jgi:hypothetical protein
MVMPVLASVTDVVVAPGDSTTGEGRAGLFSHAVAATRQANALQNARDFNVICSYQAVRITNENGAIFFRDKGWEACRRL